MPIWTSPVQRGLAGQGGDPEVHQARPVRAQDDVGGLQVTVEDALVVRVVQRGGQGPERAQRLGQGHGAVREALVQRLALGQLHHQAKEAARGVLAEAHHLHDGRMAQGGERFRFAYEEGPVVGLSGRLHDLERRLDAFAQGGVDAIDGPHGALPQQGVHDPVRDAISLTQHAGVYGRTASISEAVRVQPGAGRCAITRRTNCM